MCTVVNVVGVGGATGTATDVDMEQWFVVRMASFLEHSNAKTSTGPSQWILTSPAW